MPVRISAIEGLLCVRQALHYREDFELLTTRLIASRWSELRSVQIIALAILAELYLDLAG